MRIKSKLLPVILLLLGGFVQPGEAAWAGYVFNGTMQFANTEQATAFGVTSGLQTSFDVAFSLGSNRLIEEYADEYNPDYITYARYKASTGYVKVGDKSFVLYHTKNSGLVVESFYEYSQLSIIYEGDANVNIAGNDILIDRLYLSGLQASLVFHTPDLYNLNYFNDLEDRFGLLRFEYGGGKSGQAYIYNLSMGLVSDSAIPAVPEPSSWTFLLIGFCLSGIAVRRRRHMAGYSSIW
ncbi:PEP-CTERM sorting domain-containing protein [Pseudokordiimonas caeni]|uniref:PEP-CTERM sorting domain-containing protein n=1 Tax=Pseudokordiimonas caeni TaxID=2997908 RepID=UPI002811D41A|nr:PEP-CTERM sorting domain-containing protein [Pseudokordiimonas caeni]